MELKVILDHAELGFFHCSVAISSQQLCMPTQGASRHVTQITGTLGLQHQESMHVD